MIAIDRLRGMVKGPTGPLNDPKRSSCQCAIIEQLPRRRVVFQSAIGEGVDRSRYAQLLAGPMQRPELVSIDGWMPVGRRGTDMLSFLPLVRKRRRLP
jgi:hypothetical protein